VETNGTSVPARAAIEVVVFVGVWMTLGFALRLDENAYLLAGVPLTAAFQLLVARRPLRALWLREPAGARRGLGWALVALALAAWPAVSLVRFALVHQFEEVLWCAAAIAGAAAAALALCNRRAGFGREVLLCLATAGAVGVFFVLTAARHAPSLAVGVSSLLLYFPVCFVLEEVTFRGALDTHLEPAGRCNWETAVLVGALWGAWHLPTVPGPKLHALPGLLLVQIAVGVPLSLFWRRSGNLAVPALTHAVIDAVRNAFLG